jgi:hypothetical protein
VAQLSDEVEDMHIDSQRDGVRGRAILWLAVLTMTIALILFAFAPVNDVER